LGQLPRLTFNHRGSVHCTLNLLDENRESLAS
jgi:hypothetical protein